MFEARMTQGALLKKLVDAIKEFVTEANFDCSATSISLQAMDSAHVSLVALLLRSEGFEHYRCDRNISLGINISSLSKVLRCANNDDVVTLKASDSGDSITFMFENANQERVSDFELKLMDIDGEHLGIPDTHYKCTVTMPAGEFQRICRDLTAIGDTVQLSCSKDGLTFSVSGDLGTGNITCRQSSSDEQDDATIIQLEEPISLTFALKYLNFFAKATSLSGSVTLRMTDEAPLVVEYLIDDMGYLRYYLAPKIEDNES